MSEAAQADSFGWSLVADGLEFPEGPVVCADGSVLVVEIAAGCITRVTPDGAKTRIASPGGGPNGLALGPDGQLYLCNNGGFGWVREGGLLVPHGTASDYRTGAIQRIDPVSGQVTTLYETAQARDGMETPLRGPNDLVFDAQGGFWFSDFGKTMGRSRDVTGLCYARPDGGLCREVVFPLENPNGVGLSPDGRTLYAAETYTSKLWAFTVESPGRLATSGALMGSGGTFLHSPAGLTYFDSLAVEACGNVCVATIGAGGFTVVAPDGAPVEFVPTGDPFTTNIAFGGPDLCTAWATLSGTGRLVKKRWARPGLALNQGTSMFPSRAEPREGSATF